MISRFGGRYSDNTGFEQDVVRKFLAESCAMREFCMCANLWLEFLNLKFRYQIFVFASFSKLPDKGRVNYLRR